MTPEKRSSPRVSANLLIDFSMDEENVFLFFVTSDISKAGVFIDTEDPLPVGTNIDMIISHFDKSSDDAAKQLVLRGEVIQTHSKSDPKTGKGPGMGVKWLDLTDDSWAFLEKAASAATEENPMEMGVVTDKATDAVKSQLELIRRHSKDLKKEAARFLNETK